MNVRAAFGARAGTRSRFAVLTAHFFGRFFRNEVVDFEDQTKERLIAVLAILASILGWSASQMLVTYQLVPEAIATRSWQEKFYHLSLVMMFFGFLAVLLWDYLLPDRQDFVNLTPLPLRVREIFLAKLAAFVILAGVFSVGMSLMAAPIFGMMLTPPGVSVLRAAWHVAAHMIAVFAANLSVLFALLAVQFVVMTVLPAALARAVVAMVRFAALAGLILVFAILSLALNTFRGFPVDTVFQGDFLPRFPPLWFVGLYERLLGNSAADFGRGARLAGIFLAGSVLVFFAAAALSYRRYLRDTLEVRKRSARLERLRRAAAAPFRAVLLQRPEERAAFQFASSVLRSSPRHRSRMNLTMGIAAGLAAAFALAYRTGFRSLSPDNLNLLGLPLFVAVFVTAGWRRLAEIPAAAGANWLFEVSESPRRELYLRGAKKAWIARALLPFWALVGIAMAALPRWDAGRAALHAVYGLAISVLALEALFARSRKIPFVCTFLPGKLRLEKRGIPILFGGIAFFWAVAQMERELLARPWKFAPFLAAAAAAWALLRVGERRFLRATPFVYEEEPEPALITFPS